MASVALLAGSASAADLLYDLKFGKEYNADLQLYPKNNAYTGTFTYSLTDTETFSVSYFNNNNNGWDFIKCGRKSVESTGYITTDFMVGSQVTSVELTIPAWTADKVNAIMLQTSASANAADEDWTTVATHGATYDNEEAQTVTLSAPAPAPNLYYRIAFDCAAGSANGLVSLSEVKYYGEGAGEDVQQPAGFSFAASTLYTTTSLGTPAPEFNNPNGVAVTFSSSNSDVVEVAEDGAITVKGEGTAEITATSEATAEYLAGSAKYTVVVAPSVTTHNAFIEASKESGDVIYVNFYYSVEYVNGAYIYAADVFGNPVLFYNSGSSYEPGDMLKGGYFVQYVPYNLLPEWKFLGDFPEVFIKDSVYPQTFTSADEVPLNQVCYLANVTFDEATPTDKGKTFKGTMADGSEFTFYTQWAVEESVEPGTYTVYGAMGCYKTTMEFFPISYEVYEADPELPTSLKVSSDAPVMTYDFTPADGEGVSYPELEVKATTDKDSVVFEIEVPEGWTNFIYQPVDGGINADPLRRAAGLNLQWTATSEMEAAGWVVDNKIEIPSDVEEYSCAIFLVKGNKACTNAPIACTFSITYDINSGVEGINAANDAEAVYYNLSGVRVDNPAEGGVFIKVAGGKAVKVVL